METPLKGERLEHWQQLCAQAATEQDPQKLMDLVKEIDRLLGEKQDRLNRGTANENVAKREGA
jgi:hypothetical protein